MTLLDFSAGITVAVLALVIGSTAACTDRSQLRRTARSFRSRLRVVAPHLLLLAVILVINKLSRGLTAELSLIFDLNITSLIYAIEGNLVGTIQSVQQPVLTAYFSFTYLAGYIALLVLPFVIYFIHDELRVVRQTAIAYASNYAIGLACYVAFISFGPRNLIPDVVNQPLYSTYPEAQLLTGQWNANTNVFPSLHASLSVTVALLAIQTRSSHPRWAYLATFGAFSVVFSTVYLGIHWVTDVVAGLLLGWFSVRLASHWVDRKSAEPRFRATQEHPESSGD